MEGSQGELVDIVLAWSISDVCNKGLYKQKVSKIPGRFLSIQQYFASFVTALIEETHEDLRSSMELLSKAPVLKVEELKRCGTEPNTYKIKVGTQKSSSENSTDPFIPQRDYVFALSEVKPSTVADLGRDGKPFLLGVVTGCKDEQSGPTFNIKIKTSKPVSLPSDKEKSLFTVFLTNIKTYTRIWESLCGGASMKRNYNVIKEVLNPVYKEGSSCNYCSSRQDLSVGGINLWNSLDKFNLNESQKNAVLSCVPTRQCSCKDSIELIWGPPGTGKTKTVSALLLQLKAMKCRTLTCAPTNVAVVELASRLLKLVRESYETEDNMLGDIVLFGNKERMIVDDDAQDILLDFRVDRLAECFAPSSGWTKQLNSMIEFLEDCPSHYRVYIENEEMKDTEKVTEKQQKKVDKKHKKDVGKEKKELLKFREFVERQFCLIAKALINFITNLCTHLPTPFLSEGIFRLMTLARALILTFESLLGTSTVSDEELEELFLRTTLENGSKLGRDNKFKGSFLKQNDLKGSKVCSLYRIKNECLMILWSLREKLKIPQILDKASIKEFCLRGASLIFCTVSSSFRLHLMEVQPIELLVVDEAAQLKECESTIPLQLLGIKRAILIGDECQLPALVKSKVSEKNGFGRSLFERLSSLGHQKHLLNVQYRMHPSISSFSNTSFYKNRILDAPKVTDKSYVKNYLPGRMYGPYSFINVPYGKEVFDNGCSPKNNVEVAMVLQLVRRLFEVSLTSKQKLTVGVISPYAAQVSEIQEKLVKTYNARSDFVASAKSIDGFQGGEEDVIIISTVRSNSKRSIGFISNCQRANVALTRARHCLWILGNELTLTGSNNIWKKVVLDAKRRGCYFNFDEDKHLAEAAIPCILELNQLDGLLHMGSFLFKRARWKVQFTTEFRNSFQRIKNASTKKEVIEILMKLSSGLCPNKGEPNLVDGSCFQLLKKYDVKGQHLTWSVDVTEECSMHIQVLTIWDIIPTAEMPTLVLRSNNIFAEYTEDRILKCKYEREEGGLLLPMSWNDSAACTTSKSTEDLSSRLRVLNLGKDYGASVKNISSLFKPVNQGKTHVASISESGTEQHSVIRTGVSVKKNSVILCKSESKSQSKDRDNAKKRQKHLKKTEQHSVIRTGVSVRKNSVIICKSESKSKSKDRDNAKKRQKHLKNSTVIRTGVSVKKNSVIVCKSKSKSKSKDGDDGMQQQKHHLKKEKKMVKS